jgi:hypothetical protein
VRQGDGIIKSSSSFPSRKASLLLVPFVDGVMIREARREFFFGVIKI